MTAFLVVIAVAVVGLLIGLCIPVDLEFTVGTDDITPNVIRLSGLFGLIRWTSGGSEPGIVQRAKPSHASQRPTDWRRGLKLVGNSDLRDRSIRYGKKLLKTIDVRTLTANVRFGLDDPADTGCVWGGVWPLQWLANKIPGATIRITPDFHWEGFSVHGEGSIRFIPAWTLWVMLCFMASPATIHALARSS